MKTKNQKLQRKRRISLAGGQSAPQLPHPRDRSLWITYVTSGQEFALVEDCEALGIKAIAPRKVEAVRTGNNRYPEPKVTPYLPNYVFCQATADEWHWLREIKYVRDIMGVVPQWERKVQDFCDTIESQYRERMAEIDQAVAVMRNREASKEQRRQALKVIQHYQPSDLLEVITGPFAGMVAQFGRMVEAGSRGIPEIEATVMMFGRATNVAFDPLEVRKVG